MKLRESFSAISFGNESVWLTHVCVFSCSRVLVFSCSRVLVFSCSRVLVFSCSRVLVFSCSRVLVFSCSRVLVFSCLCETFIMVVHWRLPDDCSVSK